MTVAWNFCVLFAKVFNRYLFTFKIFTSGDELEYLRPNVYRNVARQLNIPVASENVVSDAFLAVAAEIFSTGE